MYGMIRQRLALIGHNDFFNFYYCIFGVLVGIYEEFQTDACQACSCVPSVNYGYMYCYTDVLA